MKIWLLPAGALMLGGAVLPNKLAAEVSVSTETQWKSESDTITKVSNGSKIEDYEVPLSTITAEDKDVLVQEEFSGKPALKSADWVRDAVIYEVYPRAFSEDGKFKNIEDSLEDLKDLGVTCLWIMPVNPVGQTNKKGSLGCPYSVKDYLSVNREYGTKDGLKQIVSEAHQNGLKVIIDWVANHTSWDNPMIKLHPKWYKKDDQGKIIPPNPHWTDVAQLDYSNPDLRNYMKDALIYWLKEYDLDGFRCDVADMVPLDFWEDVRKSLAKIKPDLFMLAEGDNPKDHLASFDMTYSWNVYESLEKIYDGKADATLLDAQLKKESALYPDGSLRLRFSENHDKERAMKRFGPANQACAALVFTMNGTPMIYSGQEIGETRKPSLFEKEAIDWKSGVRKNSKLRKFYKKLCSFRKEHPSISHGQRFKVNTSDDKQVFAFARSYREDAVLVAINFSPKQFKGTMDVPEIFFSKKGTLEVKALFPEEGTLASRDHSGAILNLPPWGYQVWEVR